MRKIIIGLTGTKASGKGEIIKYLKSIGFVDLSLSDIVRQEAKKRNLEITTPNLQDIGDELRKKGGTGILAKIISEKLETDYKNKSKIVIDSIRNPGEIKYFIKKFKKTFHLIGVDADEKIRLKRYLNREGVTKKEFEKDNNRDIGKWQRKTGQQVEKCLNKAEIIIKNNGSLANLKKELHLILKNLIH